MPVWWVWPHQSPTERGSGCGQWLEDCGRREGEAWGEGDQLQDHELHPLTLLPWAHPL